MKFIGKRFIPVDNSDQTKAIFIVGEAQDGMDHYVALLDLYNIEDRWVEIMSITNVATDPTGESKPSFSGTLRKIDNDEEWRTAVACFNERKVFEEFDWNEVDKRVVNEKIKSRLRPYEDWWFDRKHGEDNMLGYQQQQIDSYTHRFKDILDKEKPNGSSKIITT